MDELGNAVPLPNLAEIASSAASHNIQLIGYRDQALTLINISGIADIETREYFSELVGEEEIKDSSDPDAPVGRRPLAPPDELRQIKPEHGLLIYGSLRPALLRLRLYFNDLKLKASA